MAGVSFLPIQAGTGDPSPTNVRPITPGLSITGIGDIYGGYLDVANGCVVEEYGKTIVASSNTTVRTHSTAYYPYYMRTQLTGFANGNNTNAPRMCDSLTQITQDEMNSGVTGYYRVSNTQINVYWVAPDCATEEGANALRDTGYTFVYKLATPITHPLTTAQLIEAMQKLKVPSAPAQALHRRLVNTPHPVSTTPASIASFDTDMVGKLRSAKFAFMPVQSGSGDPSPTNVRPISGWDGVTVGQSGKNLLKSVILQGGINGNNGTIIENNKQIHTDISCYKAGNYVISNANSGFYVRIFVYALDGTYIRSESRYAWQIMPHSFTLVGDRLVIFNWSAADSSVITPSDLINPQLEFGSTATPYTPYTGSTYPVTWQSAGTIYGGYVDLCKGVVVAEWVSCNLDSTPAKATWYDADIDRDTVGWYCEARLWGNTDYPIPADGSCMFDYCKVGVVYNENTSWLARFLFMGGSFNRFEMRLPKSVLDDVSTSTACIESIRDYLDAHPLQAVYKISPITYAITPTIIKSLRGANNLWSNANGDATITYWTH